MLRLRGESAWADAVVDMLAKGGWHLKDLTRAKCHGLRLKKGPTSRSYARIRAGSAVDTMDWTTKGSISSVLGPMRVLGLRLRREVEG